MKSIFKITFLLLFLNTQAQHLEKSLLWQISGNGLQKPSFLYGTIHATCDAALEQNVTDAINKSEQLYLELDMDDPKLQTVMMMKMNMKDGKRISELVSKEDYVVVDTFLKKNIGIPLSMLNTVKPFFVSAMLLPNLLDCPVQSVEQELIKLNTEKKQEVFGLETINEQMDAVDAIPYQDQMDELVKTAKSNLSNDKKEFLELMKIYKDKDLDAMLKVSESSDNVLTSKFENELLTKRNENWIPRIEKIIMLKSTFFGVGAAHLGGENGVIKLLRKKGYTVTAVQ